MQSLSDGDTERPARPANRLRDSRSPYLAAHSRDPVSWRPWGSGALGRAQRLDRPLMISIGYQSCHWCHVMQRESFMDADLAGFINRHFVPIKIDRELRPDLDALYMSFVTATTGSGGWPLTVFATPGGVPFFGGTYFPRQSADPRIMDFPGVLDGVLRAWKLERADTMATAHEALAYLRASYETVGAPLGRALIDEAASEILRAEDTAHGGIGFAPKFPQAPACTFLLGYHRLTGAPDALAMVRRWIDAMLGGGIYDQAEGGLFRYSTDESWTVPHFEKMLYDQGLLLSTLAAVHELAPQARYELAARRTAEFLHTRLARPEGGFFSSLDAETDHVEGATYLWTAEELLAVLDEGEREIARRTLGLDAHDPEPRRPQVLVRRSAPEPDADAVDAVVAKLARVRTSRPQPARIENTIVSWNALAARGLIESGMAFGSDELLSSGVSTLEHLLRTAVVGASVRHALDDGSVAKVRLLEDVAALTGACIVASQATGRTDLIRTAERLHRDAGKRFRTDDGRMLASAGTSTLPLVPVDQADAAVPSGAALFAENGALLSRLLGKPEYAEESSRVLRQFERAARAVPALAGHALYAATLLERT